MVFHEAQALKLLVDVVIFFQDDYLVLSFGTEQTCGHDEMGHSRLHPANSIDQSTVTQIRDVSEACGRTKTISCHVVEQRTPYNKQILCG